jgi:hypothetical protein
MATSFYARPRPTNFNASDSGMIDALANMAPGEQLSITIDFSTRPLKSGETLESVASTAITNQSNANGTTDTLDVASASVSGTVLTVDLIEPTLGCVDLVEALVNTSNGQIRAAVVQVNCSLT